VPAGDPVFTIANGLFAQVGYPILDAFMKTLAGQYGGEVRRVDFVDEKAALAAINGYVAEHTGGYIPTLLDHLDPLTRFAILNAVYLDALWARPFDGLAPAGPKQTLRFAAPGGPADVPSMRDVDPFPYSSGDGWSAVTLPYIGDRLAMRVILPAPGRGVSDLLRPDALPRLRWRSCCRSGASTPIST
jgi:serpin B